jgi:F-type H+-transporting ATPase subunit delta
MMTGKLTTLARPYAAAAFEYALAKNALPEWEGMLQSGALLVEDPGMAKLLNSPGVSASELGDLFCEVLAQVLTPEKTNFIRLLAVNKRLSLLPDIAALFASYRAEHEKNVTVDVISATSLSEPYQQQLIKRLSKRLQSNVTLRCQIDPTLIGGAILRAGDMVIDGSVRGKLNRLLESL